jgi:hypothetical protein
MPPRGYQYPPIRNQIGRSTFSSRRATSTVQPSWNAAWFRYAPRNSFSDLLSTSSSRGA